PRQRAPLVVLDRPELGFALGARESVGHQRAPGVPHADEVDLRLRDPERRFDVFRVGLIASDHAREALDLGSERGVVQYRHAQAMAARVAGGARLAGRAARPGAGARIDAGGVNGAWACHSAASLTWNLRVQACSLFAPNSQV